MTMVNARSMCLGAEKTGLSPSHLQSCTKVCRNLFWVGFEYSRVLPASLLIVLKNGSFRQVPQKVRICRRFLFDSNLMQEQNGNFKRIQP